MVVFFLGRGLSNNATNDDLILWYCFFASASPPSLKEDGDDDGGDGDADVLNSDEKFLLFDECEGEVRGE